MDSIRRVAIVGGGPTGIACAKHLLAEQAFDTIDVFEQRDNVGGIWNLSGADKSRQVDVPQTDARYGINSKDHDFATSLEFESPLYDYLETNIPKPLMAYSDTDFDASLPLFPGHADVLRYLECYARPVRHLVHFHTRVVKLRSEAPGHSNAPLSQKWTITTRDIITGSQVERRYDAVVVANGHYTIPHVPAVPGLARWQTQYPGSVIHSKAYRRPEDFKDKKVLVIGNSASGLDIAAQLAAHTQTPVYLASRSASQLAPSGGGPTWRKDVAEIEEFLDDSHNRAVRTKKGEVVEGLDVVIFATGYFYSFPFISSRAASSSASSATDSPTTSTSSLGSTDDLSSSHVQQNHESSPSRATQDSLAGLITSGLRTHDVYKHFIHIDHPTLAFPVLNLKVIPFPLAENQAAVLARLWSGRLELPCQHEMRTWEAQEEQRLLEAHRLRHAPDTASGEAVAAHDDTSTGASRYEGGFHTLVYPEDANQINSLYAWAASAKSKPGLDNEGAGKLGSRWDERQVWMRGQFPNIKAAYAKHGSDRVAITDLSSLGGEWEHGFENWKTTTPLEEQKELFSKAGVLGWQKD